MQVRILPVAVLCYCSLFCKMGVEVKLKTQLIIFKMRIINKYMKSTCLVLMSASELVTCLKPELF